MLRSYEKLLRTFPYSRLTKNTSTLRITAVSSTEPVLYEQSFEAPPNLDAVLEQVREFTAEDCSAALDTHWDLWQFERDWKLAPARIALVCFGPGFEADREDDIRIEFGIDTHFLPQADLPNSMFMARSNIRSLLHLVHELDAQFSTGTRRLWSESGENFAVRLQAALEEPEEM